jgi:hypothetical protein
MSHTPNVSLQRVWTHQIGALAWVKSPSTEPLSWVHRWPVLLFPSWSTAMTSLGDLLPENNDSDQVHIQGCKTPVSIQHLRNNMVPARAALGPAMAKYNNKRGRIVAYFLGRPPPKWGIDSKDSVHHHGSCTDYMTALWAAVDVDSVIPYTVSSCSQVLQSCFSPLSSSTKTCGDILADHRDRLIGAMKEASIVCQCNDLDPHVLAPHFFPVPKATSSKPSSYNTSSSTVIPDQTSLVFKTKSYTETPEFFDEWRVGQSFNTQRLNSQNETQFSQGLGKSLLEPLNEKCQQVSLADGEKDVNPKMCNANEDMTNHMTGRDQLGLGQNERALNNVSKAPPTQESFCPDDSVTHNRSSIHVAAPNTICETPMSHSNTRVNQSDETPITSNVSQSQLNAASVLMTLTHVGVVSPNSKLPPVIPPDKRTDELLSVSFDLNRSNEEDTQQDMSPKRDDLEPMDELSHEQHIKRRRFTVDHDHENSVSSYCSLQNLTSLPIVTPKVDMKKSRGLDDSLSEPETSDSEGTKDMENVDSENRVLSSESSSVSLPLYTQ